MGKSDLEMTKLCAEAMGLSVVHQLGALHFPNAQLEESLYDPLHDDAQCFALVKRFSMEITRHDTGKWFAWLFYRKPNGQMDRPSAGNRDLNRAIVECVAKMQAATPGSQSTDKG